MDNQSLKRQIILDFLTWYFNPQLPPKRKEINDLADQYMEVKDETVDQGDYRLKAGKRYIIDKEFANSGEVELVRVLGKY